MLRRQATRTVACVAVQAKPEVRASSSSADSQPAGSSTYRRSRRRSLLRTQTSSLRAVTLAALAARRLTNTIPIVFAVSADPVDAGLVKSLPQPGGNITG